MYKYYCEICHNEYQTEEGVYPPTLTICLACIAWFDIANLPMAGGTNKEWE